ncbi:MAG: roadblock/LC7 domain-containing protein [Planctomycetales bacterium]|nr:roadblock/LC7 domain-containing protein [Planctomycetales bacterium]
MRDEQKLREQRLVFYRDDMEKIGRHLTEFLKLAGAKCAILVDKEGHMVDKRGESGDFDLDTISALVAGSFAATKEMARILGEEQFTVLFHQGQKESIQLTLVGDRTLLTVIFDESTTLGVVRLYADEVSKKLAVLFEKIKVRGASGAPPEEGISQEFGGAAKTRLDELFGK